jgi:hypothetical protein
MRGVPAFIVTNYRNIVNAGSEQPKVAACSIYGIMYALMRFFRHVLFIYAWYIIYAFNM